MKVHQDPISNGTGLDEKKNVYMIFSAYYHNQLWESEDIQKAVDILRDFAVTEEIPILSELKRIEQSSNDDRAAAYYDFAKLFIGPDQLRVPPYESVYVNQDRLIMTESTLKVRNFYEMCGVEISAKGKFPEDHMAFEMEFLAYLYHQTLQERIEKARIGQFMQAHLSKWYREHLNDVIDTAKSDYCRAWAIVMLTIIEKDLVDIKKASKGGL